MTCASSGDQSHSVGGHFLNDVFGSFRREVLFILSLFDYVYYCTLSTNVPALAQ